MEKEKTLGDPSALKAGSKYYSTHTSALVTAINKFYGGPDKIPSNVSEALQKLASADYYLGRGSNAEEKYAHLKESRELLEKLKGLVDIDMRKRISGSEVDDINNAFGEARDGLYNLTGDLGPDVMAMYFRDNGEAVCRGVRDDIQSGRDPSTNMEISAKAYCARNAR